MYNINNHLAFKEIMGRKIGIYLPLTIFFSFFFYTVPFPLVIIYLLPKRQTASCIFCSSDLQKMIPCRFHLFEKWQIYPLNIFAQYKWNCFSFINLKLSLHCIHMVKFPNIVPLCVMWVLSIMLSEISQAMKDKYHMISPISGT